MTTPAAYTVELASGAGVTGLASASWTDFTAFVSSVVIRRGRATSREEVQPATCEIVIDNAPVAIGVPPLRLSHLATVSGFGLRVRVTPSGGAVQTVFLGWVDRWEPDADPVRPTLTAHASDVLAALGRVTMRSLSAERLAGLPRHVSLVRALDFWPLSEETSTTRLANAGGVSSLATGSTAGYTARVVQPSGVAAGALELGQPDGLLVDGAATLTRGDGGTPSPVILARLRHGMDATTDFVHRVGMWTRLERDPAGYDTLWSLYDESGVLLMELGPEVDGTSGHLVWRLKLGDGGTLLTYDTGSAGADGAWRWIDLGAFEDGFTPVTWVYLGARDAVAGYRTTTAAWGVDQTLLRRAHWIVIGGRMNPLAKGKQGNTFQGSIAEPFVAKGLWDGVTSLWWGPGRLSQVSDPITMTDLVEPVRWASWDAELSVGGLLGWTADDTPMLPWETRGGTALDALQVAARTVGGALVSTPAGRPQIVHGAQARPVAVSLTIDAAADLHLEAGGLPWAMPERPTRQTVSSPDGTVTVVGDAAAEAAGLRVEGDEVFVAGPEDVARAEASWRVSGPRSPRIASMGVDLSLTENNLWAAALALTPGSRVRLTGLDALVIGWSRVDSFVQGFTLTLGGDGAQCRSAVLVLDCEMADDPPEAVTDDGEFGRVALDEASSVTGGTCVGSTGTGTLFISSATPLTTDAAAYPLDLLVGTGTIGAERVTVSSPPASATSPQTVTVTARGVAPSIALGINLGAKVQLWQGSTVAR